MAKYVMLLLSGILLTSCVGMVSLPSDPVTRAEYGVVGGAATGCAVGALMTVWTGPGAAAGCAMGAMAGAGMGGMLGVATAQ